MFKRYLSLAGLVLVLGVSGVTLASHDLSGPGRSATSASSAQAEQRLMLSNALVQAPPQNNGSLVQKAPVSEEDMTVLARGPIHEAYAQPYEQAPRPSPVVPKKPPEPIPEVPPEQKPAGDNVIWIPGYWSWDSEKNDYFWVSGSWRVAPPDRRWVPGYWTEGQGGWHWVSGMWAPAAQAELRYQPEPPATLDYGPSVPAPDDDSFYVPGTWTYNTAGYAWRPGYWQAYRPGYVWCPARYYWTPSGYLFCDGYWDYCLEDRGLLFAPVWFHRPLWLTPGWFYRPAFVFGFGFGFRTPFFSLFVRPGWGHYYFGDYFGRAYVGLGFRPWYAYGPRFRDPLFGYYRWHNRGNPNWYAGLRDGYLARRTGELPRPPRTWAEQNRLGMQANNFRPVAPLNQVVSSRLTRATAPQLAVQRSGAQQFRELSAQRQRSERFQAGAARTPFRLPAQASVGRPPTTTAGPSTPGMTGPGRAAVGTPGRLQGTSPPLQGTRAPQALDPRRTPLAPSVNRAAQTARPPSFSRPPTEAVRPPNFTPAPPVNRPPQVIRPPSFTPAPPSNRAPQAVRPPSFSRPPVQSVRPSTFTPAPPVNRPPQVIRPPSFSRPPAPTVRPQSFAPAPSVNRAPQIVRPQSFSRPPAISRPPVSRPGFSPVPSSRSFRAFVPSGGRPGMGPRPSFSSRPSARPASRGGGRSRR